MSSAICIVPVSPLRSLPGHRAEMVSQLLFGESVKVIDKENEWLRISCIHDSYEGWCQRSHIMYVDELTVTNEVLIAGNWDNQLMCNDQLMHIPMGSLINSADLPGARISSIEREPGYVKPVNFTDKQLIARARMFLNTAYLWGGRSVYGVDCSGFCQVVFRFFGVSLPRDAYQQAGTGEPIGFLQEARTGDLAFFDNEEGRITHVGILLDQQTIIHASGKVRIDKIDTEGIFNVDTRQRTHKLRVIKRYF